MTRRSVKNVLHRIQNLPRGANLLRYLANKGRLLALHLSRSANVAYPPTIMFEVTNHCQLKCVTCPREYAFGKQMDKGFMDFERFKAVMDEASPYLDSVGLTGLGETFLYQDLPRAAEYVRAKNRGIRIFVSTNAHLENSPEIVAQLVRERAIDTIQISIDGVGEVYNRVRVQGDFAAFQRNVRHIAQIAAPTETKIMFNMVVLEENYAQMADLFEFAHREGIKHVTYTPLNLAAVTDKDLSYYRLFTSEKFLRELRRLRETAERYPEMTCSPPNFSENRPFEICRFPWWHVYITWNGYLVPCCAKPFPKELHFGNVFEDGLLNTLNSARFQQFRTLWLTRQMPPFCARCYGYTPSR